MIVVSMSSPLSIPSCGKVIRVFTTNIVLQKHVYFSWGLFRSNPHFVQVESKRFCGITFNKVLSHPKSNANLNSLGSILMRSCTVMRSQWKR